MSGDSLIECATIALNYFPWLFNAPKIHPWTDTLYSKGIQ
jgi:hypothetical protein